MKMAQTDIKNGKTMFFLILNFKDGSQLCYKIYNKMIFMQYVCKSAHKLFFHVVIMGVIIVQIFIIISNISLKKKL